MFTEDKKFNGGSFVFWGGGVSKRDEHDLLPKLFLEFVEANSMV